MAAINMEDASGYPGRADSLYSPSSEAELLQLLRDASEQVIPVTIVGARTGLAGGAMPEGGWAISMERFRTLDVRSGEATVGAGVLLRDLQFAATRSGQFYAPDPTENLSSIGGNIACNASGSRSFRFGDTRRSVKRLRVALMDGSVLDLGRGQRVPFAIPLLPRPSTTKFSAGFPLEPGMDFVDLFVGSEGVLGVVTEAVVELLPAPKALLSGVVFFPAEEAALDAVEAWRGLGQLRMLEYADTSSLNLLRSRKVDMPASAGAALLIESDSAGDDEVDAWLDRLEAAGAMLEESWFGLTAEDRERFRVFRHALPEAVNDTVRRRGFQKMGTDFAVPIPRNREMIAYYRQLLDSDYRGDAVIYGHIGDAHVHVNLLPKDAEEVARGKAVILEFARHAVELGGVVAAEHGLGKRKRHLLALQWSPEQLDAMKALKRRFDPQWLLGRGTLLSDD